MVRDSDHGGARGVTREQEPNNHTNRLNGRPCPRCKRFGTFAPNSIVCDRCTGALPLIFVTVTVTVEIDTEIAGGER